MKPTLIWQVFFTASGGLLTGFAFGSGGSVVLDHWPWAILIALLSGLAASIEIRVEPHGSLNLSPTVFVVATLAFGLSAGLLAAVLGPVVSFVAASRSSFSSKPVGEILTSGGEAVVSLFLAMAVLESSNPVGGWFGVSMPAGFVLALGFILQATRVSVAERIRLRRLALPLLRSSLPHLTSMWIGTILIWATYTIIGPLGIALSTVVIVELYYPWKLLGEQKELFMKSLQMMSNAVDVKDPYTAHHSRRVSNYAVMMARAMDVPEDEVERIRIGALMHDIGKIGVPGSVIRKPSKLTEEEMAIMKGHVEAGTSIVEELDVLNQSADIVRHHHENFDGSGYPAGLVGNRIPVGARIVFVADAYDALTTDRPYRRGRTISEAIQVLDANARTQFDPEAVEALKKVLSSTQ